MNSFNRFCRLLSEREKYLMEEALRQFKDVTKDAVELSKKKRKKIFIMQHASTGQYRFAENRNDVRKLERKGFEIVDEVA